MAKLSGTINNAGTPPYPITVSASATDSSAYGSLGSLAPMYQIMLPKGLTYGVDVRMALVDEEMISQGGITFPVPASSITLNGDTANLDSTVPALPAQVTISGRVTDGGGNPVNGVSVGAQTTSLTGVPNVSFISGTTTDANGSYSLRVGSGTNYQLTFVPYNK
jgi:hypothetical protein